jgi:serine/threonine protein kinase
MLSAGTVVAGKWQVKGAIGRGTFSEIYEAWPADTTAGVGPRAAAVKVITGGDQGTLRREVKCLNDLASASCAPEFYDQEPRRMLLVMQRMGESLSDVRRRLPTGYTFCVRDASAMALHMLRCINAVHRCGYVHRDVKLSNFVLGPREDPEASVQAFVIDFGLARQVVDPVTKEHQPERPKAAFRGTSMCVHAYTHAWM